MPVFAAKQAGQFFIVPVGVELPRGAFSVQSIMGDEVLVDEAAIAPYVVDEATAKERVGAYMKVLKEFAAKLTGLANQAEMAARLLDEPGAGIAVDRLLAIVGTDREEIARDPAAAVRKLGAALKRLPMETVETMAQKIPGSG